MRFVALLLAVAWISVQAAQEPATVRVTMRDGGYMPGDLVEQHIDVSLGPGERIDPQSLPAIGRITPWLEIRRVDLHNESSVKIDLVYQVFAVVEVTSLLRMPDITFRTIGTPVVREVVVAGHQLHLSPILPPELGDNQRKPREARALAPLSATRHVFLAALAGMIAAACAAFLAWIYDRLPFIPRHPGPFARLLRELRKHPPSDERDLLQKLHQAFNQSAGQTLYPATIQVLFKQAPHLVPLRSEIESFFNRSWQSFYGAAQTPLISVNEATALALQARNCERGIR